MMTIAHSEQVVVPSSSPVRPALLAFLRRLQAGRKQRRALKDTRAAFMNLVHQDERILDDIGVTREEVMWAAALPIKINAALALRERAMLRRRAVG